MAGSTAAASSPKASRIASRTRWRRTGTGSTLIAPAPCHIVRGRSSGDGSERRARRAGDGCAAVDTPASCDHGEARLLLPPTAAPDARGVPALLARDARPAGATTRRYAAASGATYRPTRSTTRPTPRWRSRATRRRPSTASRSCGGTTWTPSPRRPARRRGGPRHGRCTRTSATSSTTRARRSGCAEEHAMLER